MNFDFLVNPVQSTLPDPVQTYGRGLTLSQLARQDRMGAEEERNKARTTKAQQDAARGLALAQTVGWDQAVQQVGQENPDAAALMLELRRKDEGTRADIEYKRAQTDKERAAAGKDVMAGKVEGFKTFAGLMTGVASGQVPVNDNTMAMAWESANSILPREVARTMPAKPEEFKQWATGMSDPKLLADIADKLQMLPVNIAEKQALTRKANTEANYIPQDSQSRRITANASAQSAGTGAARLEWDKSQKSQQVVNTEMKLADDYRTQSKGFQETAGAIRKARSALETADQNPGSALAAGTAFMKILDPNSVVRESELGMALNASGWFDRSMNLVTRLQKGGVMTTQQKAALGAAMDDLWAEATAVQRQIDTQYADRARRYGADPSNVVLDLGQNAPVKPKGAAAAPAGASSGWGKVERVGG